MRSKFPDQFHLFIMSARTLRQKSESSPVFSIKLAFPRFASATTPYRISSTACVLDLEFVFDLLFYLENKLSVILKTVNATLIVTCFIWKAMSSGS